MIGLIKTISPILRKWADDIDSGECNLADDQIMEIIHELEFLSSPDGLISKHDACKILNVSRQTFDNWVKDGKVPKGKHKIGFKELFWSKREIKSINKKDI